ncbi:E3 ubiquitin-protein transferase MAEA isoform X2 [Neocloeon triangulifer]|nr:E3 ubiquitin-protein transferase MAEA isoform X2 [Neocloeon triangulifer]XP_059489658.1 E3 ubiquitin-protein transferase MAEA isoform X2 [Neocloeon triangulifer]
MADIKSLEHPTLKVPYEILNKKFRAAQKQLDREVSHVQVATSELEKGLKSENVDPQEISRILGGMVERLQVLKRKAKESITEELDAAHVCKKRLEHLKEYASPHSNTMNLWRRRRLDRMLVEYFLRRGYYGAALKLANESELQELTNLEVFLVSREVEQSLAEHQTAKCLAWCHDNKSKLRKLKSSMEFNIRIQEFVELIRSNNRMDAVKHARKYLSPYEDDQLASFKRCMALFILPGDTQLSPYKELLDENRWTTLIEQFRHENYRLFQLSTQSVFTVALQAGLSALKTPHCYASNEDRNPSCPVCNECLNELALPLPFAHCSQSRLVCFISGLPLNEHNQPMMLPNGFIYGEVALRQLASDNNGQIICPRTKDVFPLKQVEKVFVM